MKKVDYKKILDQVRDNPEAHRIIDTAIKQYCASRVVLDDKIQRELVGDGSVKRVLPMGKGFMVDYSNVGHTMMAGDEFDTSTPERMQVYGYFVDQLDRTIAETVDGINNFVLESGQTIELKKAREGDHKNLHLDKIGEYQISLADVITCNLKITNYGETMVMGDREVLLEPDHKKTTLTILEQEYIIKEGITYKVGRDPKVTNSLTIRPIITPPTVTDVSRNHCAITLKDGVVTITDWASMFGTTITRTA